MATFAKSTFNATRYAASRPTYPSQLFEAVFQYHQRENPQAKWDCALDLGCGTGQATSALARFRNVIGVDPSEGMIASARAELTGADAEKFKFMCGEAETLQGKVDTGSVDLLISAQASHWFDWGKLWPEAARVLTPGSGTAAFWVYSEMRFPKYPTLTPLITQYAQGTDPQTSLGPYWQQPGRNILANHLLDVPSPHPDLPLSTPERVYFTGPHYPALPAAQTHPVTMQKEMRWADVLQYLRTWSALHTFHERFPADAALRKPDGQLPREDSEEGDISARFWMDLRRGVRNAGGPAGVDDCVTIEWPLAMMLVRRLS
ncbi:S-adenosyl-L-methionine-dependent methyltransferase [Infundibulicybe gibba]|nr:S-adenosyl-L-methionine-dependent methyltransferase [Infundibulicybe gibba]